MPPLCRPPLACALLLAAALAAEPVSYHRHIAPILARNCHTCHGANPDSSAGGLSTRTWADLQKGGKMGPVVIPGKPEQSPLLQFVNGARGDAHRMPLGGPPLTDAQIERMRQWIAEGARQDEDTTATYRLELPSVAIASAKPVRFSCRLPVAGYVELELMDATNRTLHLDGGAVTSGHEIHWDLRRASHWPASVRARLTISHAEAEPVSAEFAVGAAAADFPAGEAAIRVQAWPAGPVVFEGRERLPAGLPGLAQWCKRFNPGLYAIEVRHGGGDWVALWRVPARSQ